MMKCGKLVIAALFLVGLGQVKADELERWEVVERMVLLDTFTDLEWTRRDNLKDINWNEAKAYCDSLEIGGGGWRLPTMDELAQFYDERRYGDTPCRSYDGRPFSCSVTPKFHLTGPSFWSSELRGSSEAWGVDLFNGDQGSGSVSGSDARRALCVRRRS